MAGHQAMAMLSGALLDAYNRVERDLALLNGGRFFTEEEWIQIDKLIHKGKYVFTDGPKSLADISPPPVRPIQATQQSSIKESFDLLSFDDDDITETTSTYKPMSETTITQTTNGHRGFEDAQKWETRSVKPTPNESRKCPSVLDGPWKGGQDVNITLAALQDQVKTHKVQLQVERGDVIKILKCVGGQMFTGKNLRTDLFGQVHAEIFYLGDKDTTDRDPAARRQIPKPKIKTLKDHLDDEELRRNLDNHETDAAAMWEKDDYDEVDRSYTQSRASSNYNKRLNSPMPSGSTLVSPDAARLSADIKSEINSLIQSRLDGYGYTKSLSKANDEPVVCRHWATKGLKCKYGANCKKLHYYPDDDHSKKFSKPQKLGRVNGKWASHMDQNGVISSRKDETCWFWKHDPKGCHKNDAECKFSHWETGKVAEPPYWVKNGATLTSEDRGSAEDDHWATSLDTSEQPNGGHDDSKATWADSMNEAAETPDNRTMILGASAGGWNGESMEAANDDSWNTVTHKKKPEEDEIRW